MDPQMSLERNKALSRRLYEEVFGHGNLDVADEILDANCVTHGPGTPAAIGTEGIKRQAQMLRTAFPDLRPVCQAQIAEADQVATRWTSTGTHTGPMAAPGGVSEPRDEPIEFDEIRVDRFADGRIVEAWFIPDRLRLWQQLGLLEASSTQAR
jgi:predicted ester cyclase